AGTGATTARAAAAQLATTQALTALEEMVDSAIATAAPAWAAKRPVIRRRPQEPWLDAHVRALDARTAPPRR
ncbi:MAG TPA: hypothetical protein VN238_16900, partial [Solirubrobacteraceae bacterium]|nr:hypothetical protein [Solirubrobacteraceae bacterium]